VRWPPAYVDVSTGAEERLRLSLLTVVRSEKLIDEAQGQFGNPEEGELPPFWKPLPSND
jgi:hypothetical protein